MTEQKKCKDGWNGATRKGTKGGVLLNKLGQVLQKNKWKIGIGVIAMVLCVSGVIASNFWRAQAVDPKASIVAYGDKSETNLRVSQLLEVVTENMEAPLTYEYSVDSEESGRLYVGADSPTMVSGQSIYGDSRYLYAKGNTGWTGTIHVKVTDRDGKTANCTYENLEKANLTKDLKSTAYGMFAGEKKDLRQVIEKAGVLHVNCANTSVTAAAVTVTEGSIFALEPKEKEYPVSGGKIKTKYCMIEATAEPEDTKEQKVSVLLSKKGCSYHGTTDGSAGVSVRIFKKPTLTANSSVGAHSVTLTGGEEGVVYYINGQGKKWENGTTELEFNNLQENTTYSVACTYTYQDEANKNKTAVAYTEIKTPEEVVVNFDTRGIGTSVASQTAIKGETVTVPTEPTADDYNFVGWYRDLAYEDKVEVGDPVQVEADTTYYAKWTRRGDYTATVTLKKDGVDWNDANNVELYDRGASAYTLVREGETNTYKARVYQGTYQVYVKGRYSGKDITVGPQGGQVELNYYTVQADIKVDNTAKTDLSVKCVHKKGTQEIYREDCTDNGNSGNYKAIVPALLEGESYEIYAEGRRVKTISYNESFSPISLSGYTATVMLQKDGSGWTDGNVAVTLKRVVEGTTIVAECEQDSTNKEQYKTVIWDSGDYKIYVKGTDSAQEIPNITINNASESNKTQTVSYYTVTAHKGVSGSYSDAGSWILRSGDKLQKPKASLAAVDKKNFLHWSKDSSNATDAFLDAQSNPTKTITITGVTNLYAYYQQPRVLIGDYVKKNENSEKTWTMPNLVIQGMDTVKIIVLETDKGKITVDAASQDIPYNTTSVDGGTYVTITFDSAVSAAAAQNVLRKNVTITGVDDAQKTIVSVYSE